MLDNDENGKDKYVLGEINCSCVGFTSQLDMEIQDKVAEEAIRQCVELQWFWFLLIIYFCLFGLL